MSDKAIDAIAAALYGLRPFDPARDTPQDVGLGGPSTEYIAGAESPDGMEFNYPQIWWINGTPVLLDPDSAYDQAVSYEEGTGLRFPRYDSPGASGFAAMNRSEMGGAQVSPLPMMWNGVRRLPNER